MSQLSRVGEYTRGTIIDQQRVLDEAYRWEIVEALMRDHGEAIMRFCVARLGEGLAEEVVQEVFVAAWEGLPRYRPTESLQAWLFGIARNKCQQVYRNRARRQSIDERDLELIRDRAHASGPTLPEDNMAQATMRGRLHDSLSKLPSEDRILLTLWYWKELPVVEIAEIMGRTEAAIRKRLTRAQQRLKELMHETLETK
jgi:RNA polymerase sigma-70 factor (ECF subfamily)